MADKKIKWTKQQQRAIEHRGSDVLVTASAGTGKTAVLSGRCADIVGDAGLDTDIWGILVVTFTDAAAEQMRERIGGQLRTAYEKTKDRRLRQQLVLLPGADISTIHSFCKRLITEHFYELGIDPGFGILDADEQKLLKTEVLEATIEWAWQQSNLSAGLEELLGGRSLGTTDGFLNRIIEISEFLDGVVLRDQWFERATELTATPGAESVARAQKHSIREQLRRIVGEIEHAQGIYRTIADGDVWSCEIEKKHVEAVRSLLALAHEKTLQNLSRELASFKKPITRTPKDVDDDAAKMLHDVVKGAMDRIDEIKELAIVNPDYLKRIGPAVSRQSRILIELVRQFDSLYSRAKEALNCFDFADLERKALQLLSDMDNDRLEPSPVALALRDRYKYVFVDEYQDINSVQKAIIDLLGKGDNVFVVGDIKQSIYAFRGAQPTLFADALEQASTKKAASLRVDLTSNFRSANGILKFVNRLFRRVMTSESAGIKYDTAAHLKSGFEQDQHVGSCDGPRVELHLLDDKVEDDDEDNGLQASLGLVTSRQRQAAMIARRIRQITGAESGSAEFEIFDKQLNETRPVEFRDIVILMRSPAKRVNEYVEILQLAGVPVICSESAGYFSTTEITDCLSLLKVLDNPQRDIELAAALRGPLFRFNDTELAKIRHLAKKNDVAGGFYNCVKAYSQQGPDEALAAKTGNALTKIEQWRTAARSISVADLIWRIFADGNLVAFYLALPNGPARKANLLKLHERAIQFEGFAGSGQAASLGRFVAFLEDLIESGREWTGAEPEGQVQNAVRITSVHKSKGLEFPVVFLAELGSRFNLSDRTREVLVDATDSLGLEIIDKDANVKLSSLAHQVIAEKKLNENLAEEMRILYVATTRACERLILSGCRKRESCRDVIYKGFFYDKAVDPWQLRTCRNALQWVLYGLSKDRALHVSLETGLAEQCDDDMLFDLTLYSGQELAQLSGYVERLGNKKKASNRPKGAGRKKRLAKSELLENVNRALNWRYDFAGATALPAKQSVTVLTHHGDEFARLDYSKSLQQRPITISENDESAALDSRIMGTAVHLVISQLDLSSEVSIETVQRKLEKLVAEGRIAESIAACIEVDSIAAFFQTDIGRMTLDSANKVNREWPFTFALPAAQINERQSVRDTRYAIRDTIVVQGIIDMLIETPQGLAIIDFKSDHITAAQVQERANLYKDQLDLYGRAAEAILNKPLLDKWLYFISPGKAVTV